jgi:RNAse (barnase) inhibitor barstar
MEKYPDIQIGQFTVQLFDRNTGTILDHDFNYDSKDRNQKVYSVHDSLKQAIEYAESKKANYIEGKNNIGYLIYDQAEKLVLHTDNLAKSHPEPRKTIIINGDNFSDIEGFYYEIDNVFTSELDWKTGHNLNAFNDILQGGFGIHEYQDSIQIVWTNSVKSKKDLSNLLDNKTLYQIITDIIKDQKHIEFIEQ